jgi:hypothetical protein
MTEKVFNWFNEHRGIRRETLEHFGVRVEDNDGDPVVHFPYVAGEKTRPNPLRPLKDGERRFKFTYGVKPPLFNEAEAGRDVVFLVEGETDTMRLWQELHAENPEKAAKVGVVGLSGVDSWTDKTGQAQHYTEVLGRAKTVFVVLDNDSDYMVKAQVDGAWKRIVEDLGRRAARRVRLPDGVKDVCEFFDQMDLETLRLLCKRGGPEGTQSRYRPLDLTKEPPEPRWLLDGLAALGDVTLLSGPPGVGKSWVTMGLTCAIAMGWSEFLGRKVLGQGRVLYVDQENPDDVIFQRLHKLGLDASGRSNLRYLWNQGVRIDRNPDEFLEEALDYSPTLILLDSLTRLHTQDENSAGSMSALFNEGIQPLARETGAAVILIHHTGKSGTERGSIDIVASADAALKTESFGEENPGKFLLKITKSRRRLGGDSMIVGITDMPDGSVTLVPSAPLEAPF